MVLDLLFLRTVRFWNNSLWVFFSKKSCSITNSQQIFKINLNNIVSRPSPLKISHFLNFLKYSLIYIQLRKAADLASNGSPARDYQHPSPLPLFYHCAKEKTTDNAAQNMQACEQTPRITRGPLRNRPLALEGLPCDWHPAWRLVISHPVTASEHNQHLRLDRDANFQIYLGDFSCLNIPPLRKKITNLPF